MGTTISTLDTNTVLPESSKRDLKRAERSKRRAVWLLMLPALAFILAVFVLPIASTFYTSVKGSGVDKAFPLVTAQLKNWDGKALPDDAAYHALASDLRSAFKSREIYGVARELNNRIPGFMSVLVVSGRKAQSWPDDAGKAELTDANRAWSDLDHWRVLKEGMATLTPYRLLAAVDLRQTWDGGIERAPENQRIYLDYLVRTFWICGVVTALCLLFAYPLAYAIASSKSLFGKIILVMTLLPFWTSILVRTAAWVIILQRNGIANEFLQMLGLIDAPLTLIYNRVGVYIVMTHVLLPFMVLPIYSVMKGIPRNLVPAAASLGAPPYRVFLEVYLPQTAPGIASGVLMTFILGLGYYITPALVGGALDQMESDLIARFALESANWGMAASLGVVLLVSMALVYVIYSRVFRVERPRLS
jgi:putative spermidine/putrescine transport system permease protein